MELESLIRQDVERTFPDMSEFRDKNTQETLTTILVIWCKLNPDISYRQGMHELLAVIYLVVSTDSVQIDASVPQTDR
jgi:hypothetical protein